MKLANLGGRAVLIVDEAVVDVHQASGGRFGPDLPAVLEAWPDVVAWAATAPTEPAATVTDDVGFGPPSPWPAQVFGVGLNYRDHAAESGASLPAMPAVFTKYPTCVAGDRASVRLPSAFVDWEVELVVVMGQRALAVQEADAWN